MHHYREALEHYFGFLIEDLGFEIESYSEEPRAFDNFVSVFRRGQVSIRIARDRSQVLIDFSSDGDNWVDKESLLEKAGISRNRFPTDEHGLWRGYEIANQSEDLRGHIAWLIDSLDEVSA